MSELKPSEKEALNRRMRAAQRKDCEGCAFESQIRSATLKEVGEKLSNIYTWPVMNRAIESLKRGEL